jgi:1-deoxy-D-xylulose-5-phosphate synthase
MVVMAPKDEAELRDMLFSAVNYTEGPIAIRYPRGSALGVQLKEGFTALPIGKAEKISAGQDVAILAVGNMVGYAKTASEKLLIEGIHCELINMRFIKPIDNEVVDNIASRFRKIVTIEENTIVGGFGSGILEYLNEINYKGDILRIGLPDKFIDHGTQAELHKILGIDPNGIVEKVRKFLDKNIN